MSRKKKLEALKAFLDEKATYYENPEFLQTDPIQIPARFTKKQDIEIAGFLTATIAWGNRKSIINNANQLMALMGDNPYDFVKNFDEETQADLFTNFKHRTFNSIDTVYFITALQHLYRKFDSMEDFFVSYQNYERLNDAIHFFKKEFFSIPHPERTKKHVGDPQKKSSCKRINMFFRWMIRPNIQGVDFGIWNKLSPSQLSCPLDVHTGNVARKLGLLERKQNDYNALLELDTALRKLDPTDPVKYDFALFGLGVFEDFASDN